LLLDLAYFFNFGNGFLEHPLNTLLEGYNSHCSPVTGALEPYLDHPILNVYQFDIPTVTLKKRTYLI
jgi:hypothetical protein